MSNTQQNRILKNFYKAAISVVMENEDNMGVFIDKLNEEEYEDTGKKGRKHTHFTDKLIDKIRVKCSREMGKRPNEGGSTEKEREEEEENLSIRKIASNIQVLSDRIQIAVNLINEIINIINWKKSDKTLAALILYTWACIYPYFFLMYPIFGVMYYLSGKYLRKHPVIEKPSHAIKDDAGEEWDSGLGPRLKWTRSENISGGMFGFLWMDEIKENRKEEQTDDKDTNSFEENLNDYSENVEIERTVNLTDLFEIGEDEAGAKHTKKKLDDEVKINEVGNEGYRNFALGTLHRFQIQSNKVIGSIDLLVEGIKTSCEFEEEKECTVLFYKLFILCIMGCVLGKYIPWTAIFIISVWIGVMMNHPNRQTLFDLLMDEKEWGQKGEVSVQRDLIKEDIVNCVLKSNVIVDEPLFVREVEVFEIEQRDVFTIRKYQPFGFSDTMFTIGDTARLHRRKPVLVHDIASVLPPEGWSFFSEERWKVDTKFGESEYLKCCNEVYVDSGSGWIYDSTEEFRRRRWKCLCIMNIA